MSSLFLDVVWCKLIAVYQLTPHKIPEQQRHQPWIHMNLHPAHCIKSCRQRGYMAHSTWHFI